MHGGRSDSERTKKPQKATKKPRVKTSQVITLDCPQSDHKVTNFFVSCELLCEECAEVSVTNFKPIFAGKNRQEILPPKNPPHNSLSKDSNFITLNFWERFCATSNEKSSDNRLQMVGTHRFSLWSCAAHPSSAVWSGSYCRYLNSAPKGGRFLFHPKTLNTCSHRLYGSKL